MKKPIINIKIIFESIFYYILSFSMFVLFVVDKLVYDMYNRIITIQDFLNAPTDVIMIGIICGLIFSMYPIIREYLIHKFFD